jgi:hypothetical protein
VLKHAVRKLNAQATDKKIVVQIRGGQYRLGETVVFGLKDSGGDSTITYEAYPDEKPVFHSDIDLGTWKKLEKQIPHLPKAAHGKVWVTNVPKIDDQPRRFYSLFDAEGLLPRARSQGFIPVNSKASSKTTLPYPSGTMRNWPNPEDIEIVVRPHHAWIVNILPLVSVDETKQIATTSVPATYGMKGLHFLPNTNSAWVENVIDALDEPGEWVYNSQESKVYLWPRSEGPPQGIRIPLLQEYLRVEGYIDENGPKDTPVRNLIFRGLTFTRGKAIGWR